MLGGSALYIYKNWKRTSSRGIRPLDIDVRSSVVGAKWKGTGPRVHLPVRNQRLGIDEKPSGYRRPPWPRCYVCKRQFYHDARVAFRDRDDCICLHVLKTNCLA
jgi:hypothetical protein